MARSKDRALPWAAQVYVAAVAAAAAGAAVPLLLHTRFRTSDLLAFAVLAVGAGAGSVLIVSTERNHGFNTALVFIGAAVLVLPPGLIAIMGIAQYAPELVRRRYPWYSQLFNLGNYTLDALAAWGAARLVAGSAPGPQAIREAAGVAAASLVLVGANHVLLAGALRLARGQPFRRSGLFTWKSLSTELLLASLGVIVAGVWQWNPFLIPLTVAPFVLISRSFSLLDLLRRSERRFRAIYESTAMGIRLTDTDGRIVTHNRAFAEMLGDDDLVGDEVTGILAEEDVARYREFFAELAAGRRESFEVEQRYRRADGETMWAHLTASLVRDADGKPEFTIGMVHDVSVRKQLEERLNQAQKLDAIGRLAGGVAHDFNNLLTVISAHCGFLLDGIDPRETLLREDVEAIAQAADRAAALTRQLLAFGRKQVLQPRLVDLNAIVAETTRMLARTLGKHVEVRTELDPELGAVEADPGQLDQVLVNLAINARDAMEGGGVLTIATENVERDGEPFVLLSVTDSGCGMDEATRAKIFEPFFTTKDVMGTGLGLASVYGIVAQSGGTIEVESAPGEGTTMAVYLPRPVLRAVAA